MEIPLEIAKRPDAAAFYRRLIANGESPRLAEMLALRKAPKCSTDDTFLAGKKNGEQFARNPALGDYYAAKLRRAGGSPAGKVYVSQLASEPGDPRAWVSGSGDVARLCQERRWGVTGAARTRRNSACDDLDEPSYGVADDIIDSELQDVLDHNGELAADCKAHPKRREDLREKIKAKRSPSYATETKKKKPKKPKLISVGK